MNRQRFWTVTGVVLSVMLASCVPPGKQAALPTTTPQRSPNISQPLIPDAARAAEAGPQEIATGNTVKVGLLLPITGRNAALGRAMQDAANLSLFDKYARLSPRQLGVKVELLPKDIGDAPEQAEAAAQAALADGAALIIGPIFAENAVAVGNVARTKNVSVISFSNSAAQASPGVYMFGFSPAQQADRMVRYAVNAGKTKVAVLAPDSALGSAVLTSARAAAAASGVPLAKEVQYPSQGVGIDAALEKLIPVEGQPNFDALLLPEGGAALPTILNALATRGVTQKNVQFLGTDIWDDATLLHKVNLEGAWVASSPSNLTAQFENRFRATQKYVPPRIASLSYDAVALAVTLATSGRPFDTPTLVSEGGFSGPANGVFRLRPTGEVERGLAVMQVRGGNLVVIDPAPAGFVGR